MRYRGHEWCLCRLVDISGAVLFVGRKEPKGPGAKWESTGRSCSQRSGRGGTRCAQTPPRLSAPLRPPPSGFPQAPTMRIRLCFPCGCACVSHADAFVSPIRIRLRIYLRLNCGLRLHSAYGGSTCGHSPNADKFMGDGGSGVKSDRIYKI